MKRRGAELHDGRGMAGAVARPRPWTPSQSSTMPAAERHQWRHGLSPGRACRAASRCTTATCRRWGSYGTLSHPGVKTNPLACTSATGVCCGMPPWQPRATGPGAACCQSVSDSRSRSVLACLPTHVWRGMHRHDAHAGASSSPSAAAAGGCSAAPAASHVMHAWDACIRAGGRGMPHTRSSSNAHLVSFGLRPPTRAQYSLSPGGRV